jgi:hypothetical protein
VVVHGAFVLFVLFGGLLVIRWRRVAWLHLPALAWGAWIEFAGSVCPLTYLENWLRAKGGDSVYALTFIERYLIPLIYPPGLSREVQVALGAFVLVVNAVIYAAIYRRRER